jgi:hypothetical protein
MELPLITKLISDGVADIAQTCAGWTDDARAASSLHGYNDVH